MDNTIVVPTMLSIKETAERTHLSERFIRKLVWNDQIKYVRTGVKYLVNLESLVDYLNQK